MIILSEVSQTEKDKYHIISLVSYDANKRHQFADKGPYSQRYGFPIVIYGCESWTIKKAECQRIDAFKLWCCRRLIRVPWTARRSNQSILKEIKPIFIGRTDAESEAPILWPPDVKS